MGRRVLKPRQKYGRLTLLSKAQKNGRSGYANVNVEIRK